MQRRDVIQVGVGAVSIAALAGCVGGPSVEVVENELDGILEFSDHEISDRETMGVNTVVVSGVISNVSDADVQASIAAEFFDGDVLVGEDRPHSGITVEPGQDQEYEQFIEADSSDISRVELTIRELDF